MTHRSSRRRLRRVVFLAAWSTTAASVLIAGPPLAGGGRAAADETKCTHRHEIAEVAERVVPSVVNVWTLPSAHGEPRAGAPTPTTDAELTARPPQRRKARSLGSGVIVSADGKVLTNAHVVRDAHKVRVTMYDGTERDAKLIGVDARSDLAVLELIDPPEVRALTFAGQSPRLGEVVLAIGNPFGVGQAVTMGIVSATGRASIGIADYEDFIQTDAAINPGNSGGALVNMDGELVGINTAILSHHGGNQGIGFAIPAAMAKPIMEMLIKDGRVSRGWLGALLAPLDEQLAAHLKLEGRGVVVIGLEEGTPAQRAGLLLGDVITQFEGEDVRDLGKLRNLVAMRAAGTEVSVEVLRDGGRQTVKITLGELPDAPRR